MDVTKVKSMLKEADDMIAHADDIRSKARELRLEAQRLCTHEVTEDKSNYYEGSYLDRAHTERRTLCAICGITLTNEVEEHSWYG